MPATTVDINIPKNNVFRPLFGPREVCFVVYYETFVSARRPFITLKQK